MGDVNECGLLADGTHPLLWMVFRSIYKYMVPYAIQRQ